MKIVFAAIAALVCFFQPLQVDLPTVKQETAVFTAPGKIKIKCGKALHDKQDRAQIFTLSLPEELADPATMTPEEYQYYLFELAKRAVDSAEGSLAMEVWMEELRLSMYAKYECEGDCECQLRVETPTYSLDDFDVSFFTFTTVGGILYIEVLVETYVDIWVHCDPC